MQSVAAATAQYLVVYKSCTELINVPKRDAMDDAVGGESAGNSGRTTRILKCELKSMVNELTGLCVLVFICSPFWAHFSGRSSVQLCSLLAP